MRPSISVAVTSLVRATVANSGGDPLDFPDTPLALVVVDVAGGAGR